MRSYLALAGSVFLLAVSAIAQSDAKSTFCNFDDDNQVSIQYKSVVTDPPRNGKVWSPGVVLYVQTPLTLGNTTLGLGAYSVHFLPEKKNWTLIVSKNVTAGAPYNASDDVARALMDVGELPSNEKQLQLAFAHMAPKQCSLRVYYQKTGAFAEFMRK
jgi:hypothetical protein